MVDEPPNTDPSALFATKTLMLENLVSILFAELYKTSPTPIKSLEAFAEHMRAIVEDASVKSAHSPAAMHLVEAYNVFWEDVIARLRAAGITK
jgi:hypothetical protein